MIDYLYAEDYKKITRSDKEKLLNQQAKVIWITGLSASGKSTLAYQLEQLFFKEGKLVQVLDGDQVRLGLNKDLNFSQTDREENIRRVAEFAKILANSGIIVICSFISPTEKIRNDAKRIIGQNDFLEIFINTPLQICELRDQKGLYNRAKKRMILNFTGIDAPYEIPKKPNFVADHKDSPKQSAYKIIATYFKEKKD